MESHLKKKKSKQSFSNLLEGFKMVDFGCGHKFKM